MTAHRPRTLAAALLAGLLLPTSFAPVAAQYPKPSSAWEYGLRTDGFRRLLHEFGLKPVNSFSDLVGNPRQSILIVFGYTNCLSTYNFERGLRSFVENGGAVLIVTDKPTIGEADKNIRELAGVRVTGEKFHSPVHEDKTCYASTPQCPYLQPESEDAEQPGSTNVWGALSAVFGGGGKPALFRNPRPGEADLRVATNSPSRLELTSGLGKLASDMHRLAHLPTGCIDDVTPMPVPIEGQGGPRIIPGLRNFMPGRGQREKPTDLLFAVGGTVGQGRVVILADHSMFINRMILPHDNGNLEFAANILYWLRGGVSTPQEALQALRNPGSGSANGSKRDRALFVEEDGKICNEFSVPLKEVPTEPPTLSEPVIVAAVNRTIAHLENSNAFNRKLMEELDINRWTLPRWRRDLVYALTLAGLVAAAYFFLWGSRSRVESGVPGLARALASHDAGATLLEQRRRAAVRAGNIGELVQQLIREAFESAGIPLNGAEPPLLASEGGWWRRWRMARRVRRLWSLACGQSPVRVPPSALRKWLRELEEIKPALNDASPKRT